MNSSEFNKLLEDLNLELNEEDISKFEKYKNYLQEYNKKFNLTSILDDIEIYIKHFYDSLCILKSGKIGESFKVLDIGTGAGFPGIPLAIARKDLTITLVESNTKKCEFLNFIKTELNLDNIIIENTRAEEYTEKTREKFDIVTSRAVSHLQVLLELEVPALKVGGYFLPLKSNLEEELKESKKNMQELSTEVIDIISYNLPLNMGKRTIPIIKKTKITNTKYPRSYSKIIKDLKKN